MNENSNEHSSSSGLSEAFKVGIEVIIALGVKDYLTPSIAYLNQPAAIKCPFLCLLIGSMSIVFYVGFGSLKSFGLRFDKISKKEEIPFEVIKTIIELLYIILVFQITFLGEQLASDLLKGITAKFPITTSMATNMIEKTAIEMGLYVGLIMFSWVLWRIVHLGEIFLVKPANINKHDSLDSTKVAFFGYILFAIIWGIYWKDRRLFVNCFSNIATGFTNLFKQLHDQHIVNFADNVHFDSDDIAVAATFLVLSFVTISWSMWAFREHHFPNFFKEANSK